MNTEHTRVALEDARYALVTLSGLVVCDGASTSQPWTIDERAVIKRLDAVLAERPSLGPLARLASPELIEAALENLVEEFQDAWGEGDDFVIERMWRRFPGISKLAGLKVAEEAEAAARH